MYLHKDLLIMSSVILNLSNWQGNLKKSYNFLSQLKLYPKPIERLSKTFMAGDH